MTRGIDYAFTPHPPVAQIKAAGMGFVARYLSPITANDSNGKNLLVTELHSLLAAGIAVVVVEESTAGRMRSGRAAGVADAQHAQAVTTALGMTSVPVYFACDFDASEADQAAIDAYLDGAASVIGRARTGIYGGYYPVKRALDAGKAAWAWQTTAWSGGQWDPRAHIRQSGTVRVGGIAVDLDQAMKSDFGQWPRPAAAEPSPTAAPTEEDDMPLILQTANPADSRTVTFLLDGGKLWHIPSNADQAALTSAGVKTAPVSQALVEKINGGTFPPM